MSVKRACSNLMIEWTLHDSGSSEITSYTLRWRSAEDFTWTKTVMVSDYATLTQQGGNYTLTGLEGGTLYSMQVEATNSIGSTASDFVNKTTPTGLCTIMVTAVCMQCLYICAYSS